MMKKNLLFVSIALLAFCKPLSNIQSVEGLYSAQGKDYNYTLNLSVDNTFSLAKKYFEVNSTCKGKWQHISKDTILLNCNEEDMFAKLQSGYMVKRENKVIVLSRTKIKIDDVVLVKKR